jgi:hypothetical protein
MLLWATTDNASFEGIGDLKIPVRRDGGKELADHRRFTLATEIEVCFCERRFSTRPRELRPERRAATGFMRTLPKNGRPWLGRSIMESQIAA